MRKAVLSVFLLPLVGCASKQIPALKFVEAPSQVYLTQEESARLFDIPFPLQVQPIKLCHNERQTVVSFYTKLSMARIVEFYQNEMCNAGWKERAVIRSEESCLVFAKPSKESVITCRSIDDQRYVTIFSTAKKSV